MTKAAGFGRGVKRITSLLNVLGRGPRSGMRLREIAAQTKLNRATAHRLLSYLGETGFVEQDKKSGHFFLGFDVFVLGAAAANRYGLADIARPHLIRLAHKTEDTTYLSVRSGFDSVCIDFHEGAYPIKITLGLGDRRPLGVGSAALVLLSFMSYAEIAEALDANRERLSGFPGFTIQKVQDLVKSTRRQGYGLFDGHIVPELCSVAVPLRSENGTVIAAIGVGSVRTRMRPKRRTEILQWMQSEAKLLEEQLSKMTSSLPEVGVEKLQRLYAVDGGASAADGAVELPSSRPSKKGTARGKRRASGK